ncbi:MAG: TrbI/VirB10 family protein [Bryobacterales bacterium]|nr:TrbI/VirB10 family protein [Bryobacterales bacterium]
MADDKDFRDLQESNDSERVDAVRTRPIPHQDVSGSDVPAVGEAGAPEASSASGGILQQIWKRIQEERSRPKRAEINARGQRNMDRSKAFLVLATAVVLVGFAFLVLFSTSGAEKRAQQRRTKPSLGRPETTTQQAGPTGSTVPLLSADQSGTDPSGDQLSPDDILATSRPWQPNRPTQEPQDAKDQRQFALSNVPPVNDPALDAYRRQNNVYAPLPAPAPQPVAVVAKELVSDTEALKKASIVFVRNATVGTIANAGSSSGAAQPVFIERRRNSLPVGSRLVARLQTAISSAVKTPAIAVIEYNYERDGEIVIPAGTKAVGQLVQANQNGQVGLRFNSLEMPDGSSEVIEGSSVGLDYGPLKGSVSGRNRAKRVLVRSVTGIGSMAAYLVGGPGYGGLTGPMDQSILLRERVASNIGLAGEQELTSLAYNQNVVITLPGNTRFYIVLQEPSATSRQSDPPVTRAGSQTSVANASAQSLPTAAELRELISLKDELNRMYREVAATRMATSPASQQ